MKTGEEASYLKFWKVAMQTNGNNCGVYAIAFATAICLGASPGKLLFDVNMMRPHLVKCLQDSSCEENMQEGCCGGGASQFTASVVCLTWMALR